MCFFFNIHVQEYIGIDLQWCYFMYCVKQCVTIQIILKLNCICMGGVIREVFF